jgi:hypothetical protein
MPTSSKKLGRSPSSTPGYPGSTATSHASSHRWAERSLQFALVLPHGHSDHIGFAERLRNDRQVPVSIHEADAALARGEVPNPAKGYGPIKIAPLMGFLWFTLLRGGLRTRHLGEVSTFGDGSTLDVPGSPRVILTPGHTRVAQPSTSRRATSS